MHQVHVSAVCTCKEENGTKRHSMMNINTIHFYCVPTMYIKLKGEIVKYRFSLQVLKYV